MPERLSNTSFSVNSHLPALLAGVAWIAPRGTSLALVAGSFLKQLERLGWILQEEEQLGVRWPAWDVPLAECAELRMVVETLLRHVVQDCRRGVHECDNGNRSGSSPTLAPPVPSGTRRECPSEHLAGEAPKRCFKHRSVRHRALLPR
jgi:hypothetical protein